MRFLIILLILPLSTYAQQSLITVQYKDSTVWTGEDLIILNGENGEKSYIVLDGPEGVEKELEEVALVTGFNEYGTKVTLEPVIYHGSLILSQVKSSSDRISIYNGSDISSDFVGRRAWRNDHYTKDGSNLREVNYTNLYEDLYENTESRSNLIKANRYRKIQNVFYGIGGVLFAHAIFNVGYDSGLVIPVTLYISATSFVIPRLLQKPKLKYLNRALVAYK